MSPRRRGQGRPSVHRQKPIPPPIELPAIDSEHDDAYLAAHRQMIDAVEGDNWWDTPRWQHAAWQVEAMEQAAFQDAVDRALEYAEELPVEHLDALVAVMKEQLGITPIDAEEVIVVYAEVVSRASDLISVHRAIVELVVEHGAG